MIKNPKSIIEQFIFRAKNYLDRPAIYIENKIVTFREVINQINIISNNLNILCKNEKTIAITMGRSFIQIISMLACLKSDKSYIILDEKIPLNKKKIIIKKLKIKTILIDEKNKNIKFKNTKTLNKRTILKKNKFREKIKHYKNEIVYYIFTSGSTGEPKGVQISNKNLLSFILNCKKTFKFDKKDKFILLPYLSFDLSVFPLWNSLFSGSTLFYTTGSDIIYPMNYIKKNKITVYCSVPSQVDVIKNSLQDNNFKTKSVRLSVFCGEPLKYSHVNIWKRYCSNSKIFNTYGPSETTCFNTYFRVQKINKKKLSEVVSLGKPMQNNKIFIKNREIIISGPQVSKGYLESRLNKNKFIINKNNVYYKTGDLAKKIGKDFYFIGRKDQQIKISGYRVELGDIEKNISKSINNKKVQAFSKKNKIYAVIESRDMLQKSQHELIKKNLPNHMIPKKIFYLSKFPLNKNMKIDRNKIINHFKNEY